MVRLVFGMKTVNIQAAKTHLSRLVEQACNGEEVVIAKGNVPMVRLVPVNARPIARSFGAYRDLGSLGDAFFEPLLEDDLAGWESGS